MSKIDDACNILKDVEFSNNINKNNMAARFILAATNITEDDVWNQAQNTGIQIHNALKFLNNNYKLNLKENTRESLRKNGPKKMETVGLAHDNVNEGIPTNSSRRKWYLSDDFFKLIKLYDNKKLYKNALCNFKKGHESRIALMKDKRNRAMIPINYNGYKFKLTPGLHNILHKEVLQKFAPKFAGGSKLLYIGDTEKKDLKIDYALLHDLGFPMNMHELIPDIILYQEEKNWIFLIECVASTGPMSVDRVKEIRKAYKGNSGLVFVTAFQDWREYKKFVESIAWETEIWIADFPDHMIHMNGNKFMGPYDSK